MEPDSSEYSSLVNDLFAISCGRLPVEAILPLSEAIGNPHQRMKIVHVAGTNGKGSVSLKIATCLELSGQKVGLLVSPHISSVRERIQVN
jgi:dihydrofolate synthase/folylpolyglutamate synthase